MDTLPKTLRTAVTPYLDTPSKDLKAQPKRVRLPDTLKRILVRRSAASRYTTVSLSAEQYATSLRFTNQSAGQVNAALRTAALEVKTEIPADFSSAVRKKALAKLRGSYRPKAEPKAKVLTEVDARLAAENNLVWEQPGSGNGGMQ